MQVSFNYVLFPFRDILFQGQCILGPEQQEIRKKGGLHEL